MQRNNTGIATPKMSTSKVTQKKKNQSGEIFIENIILF